MRNLGLLAALGASVGVLAPLELAAQTALSDDPLSPNATIKSSPKKAQPYQTFDQAPPPKSAGSPTVFQPPLPAAGAGRTGFDSTNARKRAGTKSKPKSDSNAARNTQDTRDTQQTAPGPAAPPPPSQYQRAVTTTNAANSSYAYGPPGSPPVLLGGRPPLRKKKKSKEPPLDPFDPLGYRSGGLIYYPAIELIGGYDSNPSRAAGGKGSTVLTAAPELRIRSDWPTHEFKADLRGSYNWYSPDNTPSLSRPYFNGAAEGRIDVTRDTRIDYADRVLVTTDQPNSPNLSAGLAKLPIYTAVGATAGIGQKFNRLDISIKGTIDRTDYQKSELTNGTSASNKDRDYNQYGGIARVGYELSPGVTPFVQFAADERVHDLTRDFSGYRRDSKGWTALAGSTFELTRQLTGEISAGYLRRNYDDVRLDASKGPVGNASLVWTATPLTTVKFNATSTVQESDQPGVSGTLSRDAGVQVDHSLRTWLIGSLKAGAGLDDYVGSDRTDHRYYFGGGLTYKMNRFVQIKGEARHEWLNSSVPTNNYSANIFLLGLRLQY